MGSLENEDYERLERRIQSLEQEVELLKQQLSTSTISGNEANQVESSKKTTNAPSFEKSIQGATEGNLAEETPQAPIHPSQKALPKSGAVGQVKEPIDWENVIGRVWLPRIFIFVLLMGLIWGFKVAVDYGILTEPIRVVLGFGAALGLYVLGERQMKESRQALGKALLIGSVGLLIFTTFAMNVLYGMIPTLLAFVLNVTWVGLGIYLAHRHHSQVLAILMAVVGYFIPFLVADTEHVLVGIIYTTIFYAALVYYAIYKQFKKLFYVATILLHVVYLVFIAVSLWSVDSDLFRVMALGAVVQHIIVFYSVYQFKFAKLFPVPLLFTSNLVTTLWVRLGMSADEYVYVMYLIATSLSYAFVVYMKQNRERKDLLSVALSIATFGVFLLLIHAFNNHEQALIASFLVEGVIALYLGCRFQVLFQKLSGAFVFMMGVISIMFTNIYEIVSLETSVWLLFILTLYALIYMAKRFYGNNKRVQILITLGVIFGHIQLISRLPQYDALLSLEILVTLATVISLMLVYLWTKESYAGDKVLTTLIIGVNGVVHLVLLTDLVQFITSDFSYNITMMSISFSWAFYATLLVIIGILLNKKGIRLFGIGLLILTLVKLIFGDLQYISIVVRAILFIGLGGIGLLLSRLLYVKK